jgi:translation initiation factor 2B subunit (eIF-2B alpha/beta/delta family)
MEELADDATPAAVATCLPEAATVAVIGWPSQVARALVRRLDVATFVIDVEGHGAPLAARLGRAGADATLVAESQLGATVAAADIVVLEATALGPDGLCAAAGSLAAAAVGHDAGHQVWAVAGAGRVLPDALWRAAADGVAGDELWRRHDDIVPMRLVDDVVGPDGRQPPGVAAARADCPPVPELTFRPGDPSDAVTDDPGFPA